VDGCVFIGSSREYTLIWVGISSTNLITIHVYMQIHHIYQALGISLFVTSFCHFFLDADPCTFFARDENEDDLTPPLDSSTGYHKTRKVDRV
jgi:hypothetical protein